MNRLGKFLDVVIVVMLIYAAYLIRGMWTDVSLYLYNIDKNVSIVQAETIDQGIQFDFCAEVTEDSDPVAKLHAGTHVPFEQVLISTEVAFMTPSFVESESTPIPNLSETPPPLFTPEPSPTPTATTSPRVWNDKPLNVVRAENYSDENYHIVFVPVGYGDNGFGDAYFLSALPELIDNLNSNFSGVKVDFAYADSSVEVEFKHVGRAVDFKNDSDKNKLFNKIKKVYPVDGMVVLINTPFYLGTQGINYAILSGSDERTDQMATHEIAHMFSLDDGYQFIFGEDHLPNSELFYADQMPSKLIKALEKMDVWPTLYKVGYCKEKEVFSFYESDNNIMKSYGTSEIKSWGSSTFTPLQMIIMNDFVDWFKGIN